MKRFLLFAATALTLICCAERQKGLQTGDLVFVGIPMSYSIEEGSMEEAITQSTGEGELNLIHVAIVEVQGDSTWIIDATIRHGVDRHPLDTFLKDFTLKDGSYPEFIVKRLKDNRDAERWVDNAKALTGLPYDVHFLPDNGALYCSELVRESYRTKDGGYIFDEKPMNFRGPDGEFPLYWQQLFALINSEIPQDVPGTNPQEMAAAAELHRPTMRRGVRHSYLQLIDNQL